MRVPAERRAAVHAEALRRLAEAREYEYRRYLLLDCLEAYAALDESQAEELGALLRTERYEGVKTMAVTTFEKGVQQGVQQGVEQGLQQGWRSAVTSMLEARFGPLGPGVRDRLERLGPDRLKALTREALTASSLRELGLAD